MCARVPLFCLCLCVCEFVFFFPNTILRLYCLLYLEKDFDAVAEINQHPSPHTCPITMATAHDINVLPSIVGQYD